MDCQAFSDVTYMDPKVISLEQSRNVMVCKLPTVGGEQSRNLNGATAKEVEC